MSTTRRDNTRSGLAIMPSYRAQLDDAQVAVLVEELLARNVGEAIVDATIVVDPVCKMEVRATEDAPHVEHKGAHVYFCAEVVPRRLRRRSRTLRRLSGQCAKRAPDVFSPSPFREKGWGMRQEIETVEAQDVARLRARQGVARQHVASTSSSAA